MTVILVQGGGPEQKKVVFFKKFFIFDHVTSPFCFRSERTNHGGNGQPKHRKKSAKSIEKQKLKDMKSLNALFKNKEFDSNPLGFLQKEFKAKDLESGNVSMMKWNDDKGNGKKGKRRRLRGRDKKKLMLAARNGQSRSKGIQKSLGKRLAAFKNEKRNSGNADTKLSDESVREQIAAQLRMAKQGKLKGVKATKKVLKGKDRRKGKLQDVKRGKLEKRIRQKMSQFAKDNQKKRKWRI